MLNLKEPDFVLIFIKNDIRKLLILLFTPLKPLRLNKQTVDLFTLEFEGLTCNNQTSNDFNMKLLPMAGS